MSQRELEPDGMTVTVPGRVIPFTNAFPSRRSKCTGSAGNAMMTWSAIGWTTSCRGSCRQKVIDPLVDGTQARVPVTFVSYGSESDSGFGGLSGYPIPDEARTQPNYIEGAVAGGGTSGGSVRYGSRTGVAAARGPGRSSASDTMLSAPTSLTTS